MFLIKQQVLQYVQEFFQQRISFSAVFLDCLGIGLGISLRKALT